MKQFNQTFNLYSKKKKGDEKPGVEFDPHRDHQKMQCKIT